MKIGTDTSQGQKNRDGQTGAQKSWRDRFKAVPTEPPEESILLRVLIQVLVSIGIVATDFAAADVVDSLGVSWWAVPLSLIGAAVSWQRRRQRNVAIKFVIALLMLVALGFFFVELVRRNNDTRLVLVELLIQLQVLHSFDLPRRKDLGYSIMIGLILVGVAATLSQTLTFAPFLFAFLAIALPVLILDYTSRLGLMQTGPWQGFRALKLAPDFTPKRLSVILVGSTVLGLAIFLLLPRLPGYQIRAFPVSAPIDVQGRFDNQVVLNPGYTANPNETQGEGGTSGGTQTVRGGGRSPTRGPGEVDETFYYGFNTQMNQNLRGELKPRLLMRVRSQAEGFWRVMAFDRYTGQGWEVSRNNRTITLSRSPWSYRFDVPPSGPIGASREVIQTYTIVGNLPNLIPALAQPKEVYFPTEEIAVDPEAALRSPVPLSEGMTYTVVSQVPFRNRTRLNQTGTLYPNGISRNYLTVPEAIAPKLRQRAEELLANSEKPITTPYEKALFLAKELKQRYTIKLDLPFLAEREDLASAFLFRFQGGYPDHFSTTLTMLLRSLGIPARLAVGFAPGQFNPFTGLYLVSNTDAYAVTEVYFPGAGWFAFDPIPGHELFPPSLEESSSFSALRTFWQWVAGWLPSPVRNWFSSVFLWIAQVLGGVIGWLWALLSRRGVGIWIGILLAVLASFLGWLSWMGWRLWHYQRWLGQLPPMERLYQQMLSWLADQGWAKARSQTPCEYVQGLEGRVSPSIVTVAEQIAQAYVNWRYGGLQSDITALGEQWRQVRQTQGRSRLQSHPSALLKSYGSRRKSQHGRQNPDGQ